MTLTPTIAWGGIVQGVVSPCEHSLSKNAVTVVVPNASVTSLAVRWWAPGRLETSLSIDGSPIDTGGLAQGPCRPNPPSALSNVSFNVDPDRRHTDRGCASRDTATETRPERHFVALCGAVAGSGVVAVEAATGIVGTDAE